MQRRWVSPTKLPFGGSGFNESRPKLLALLKDRSITRIVVEHIDWLTHFGFRYQKRFRNCKTEPLRSLLSDNYSDFFTIVNLAESDKEDLIANLVAIVSSFTARLYR